MSTLYIVDGSGYIFRAFYAIAPLTTSQGLPTNALYGFTKMILKLIEEVGAEHIAVAFDTEHKTFRHEMYSDYKANRTERPPELIAQMPYFEKIVTALGIQALKLPGVEADDIIATIVKAPCGEAAEKIVIVSGDKDLTQLVTERIEVYDAMREVHFTPKVVSEKFGVRPDQIVDYLTLLGDSSDNVPGVQGIGQKTAAQLLNALNSIETALKDPQKIEEIPGLRGAKKVRESFESSQDKIRLSQSLILLKSDVMPFATTTNLDEFLWPGPNTEACASLFADLEFSDRLVEKVLGHAQLSSGNKATEHVARDYRLITRENLQGFVETLAQVKEFAFDTETSSLDPHSCKLLGVSFAWQPGAAFYVALGSDLGSAGINLEEFKQSFAPIFANKNIRKSGHNLKFDLQILAAQGIVVSGEFFDSLLASYALRCEGRQHGLKSLAREILREQMTTYEELVGEADSLEAIPVEKVKDYACDDAEKTHRLTVEFAKLLDQNAHAKKLFEKIEMPLVPVLAAIEFAGIKISSDVLAGLKAEFSQELTLLEARIYELAGGEQFNLNSPKQLSEVLFTRLAIPTKGVKKTQSGFSTDAGVLEKLAADYPIVQEILQYRTLFKLVSTYIDALPQLINTRTGRVHTSFNQTVTATGRLSSSDPNLQNIPIRSEQGRRIRQAFIPEQGYKLIGADYSQIELRVLAHLAEDKNLIKAFQAGADIHTRTAEDIFGPIAMQGGERDHYRRLAKTINFGIVYGIGAPRLARDLKISRAEAESYIEGYFGRYPNVRKYFDALSVGLNQTGYVETMFGRRRYLKDVEGQGRDPGYAERALINTAIQGSAAEIMKRAMIDLHTKLGPYADKARIVLQVHDEILVEAREDLAPEIKTLVETTMENAVELTVPLRVDAEIGMHWGEL